MEFGNTIKNNKDTWTLHAWCLKIFQKDRKTRTFRKQDTFWQIHSFLYISVFFSTIVKKLSNTFDHPALFKNSSMVHIEGQKTLNDLVEAAVVF